jgi:acyl-CoA synthetase (AMP-forming)/AMP-acid ligase II/1-acyl-sn-glycerol-3-phosphate acyltransferase/acyl carrier protein
MWLQPIRLVLWFLGRVILAMRYRVTVVGRDAVEAHPGPYLILPNHPAYADPPNVLALLWLRFRMRPMLLETNFQNPFLAPFGWLLNAIKVPDLSSASAEARKRAEDAVGTAIDAVKQGDNVILWSSGRLSRDGMEHMGGARSVSDILTVCPNVTVVLVRTRGLWGSSFSWADGKKPNLMRGLFRGAALIASNLFLFTPRRRVTMTLEAFPANKRPKPERMEINHWLEAWYNADIASEKPTFVPYHMFVGPRSHEYPPPIREAIIDPGEVPEAIRKGVAEIVESRIKRPLTPEEYRPERTFQDLAIDSLDAMDIGLEVERRFGFRSQEMPTSIGGLWALALGDVEPAEAKPAPPKWFQPPTGTMPLEFLGDTIPEAILHRIARHPKDIAVADDMAGVMTYERLLLGAMVLSERFAQIPEKPVGLMLPASVAGITSLIALHLAGKLPVILNWTTGPANMEHAVKLLKLSTVITSKTFIDRTQITVPGAKLYFLEDVRATVSKWEKISKLLSVTWLLNRTIANLLKQLEAKPDDPGVVLFTSGSEKAPKAVPLTHKNIISDLIAAAPMLGLDRRDSGLVFLPLFHSFGHTVTGLLPLFTGVKAVYHPDPTDAGALAQKCAAYKTTALAATPTFLSYMLDKAQPGELASLRVIVVGAEKCPQAIFDKMKTHAPEGKILEGYGITECSPVVSVNPYDAPKPGTIGKPLIGFEAAIRDLETDERLPNGKLGMLFISGPNIFPGYLGSDDPPPFREFDGKNWYITGDLAELDPDGYILFHGRLKRFIKAGGEMISLPALEEPFAKKYPTTDAGPRVAIEGIELEGSRKIVLFTTVPMDVKEANQLLAAEGFRGVIRLDAVEQIDKIPTLGTGKTDYKLLKAKLMAG